MEDFCHYGAPVFKRTDEIATKMSSPESMYPQKMFGRSKNLPVITVSIMFPSYRLTNGRTKTAQLEYISKHQDDGVTDSLFRDQESIEAQIAQHQILSTLVDEEDLLSSFKNNQEQTEPILLTKNGIVVNGNRRLCAWRKLYELDSEKYKRFERISVAILPELSEEEIVLLEKELQLQQTHKAEYHWHTKALMIEEELISGVKTEKQIAKSYDQSVKEIRALVGAKKMAQQYLEQIAKPNRWSEVDKDKFAFIQIYDCCEKKFKNDTDKRELFIQLSFSLISKGNELDDRLYNTIKKYAEGLTCIANALYGDIPAEYKSSTAIEKDDPIALLAGTDKIEVPKEREISEAIDHGYQVSHDKIRIALDEQNELNNEKNKSQLLIKNLSKVSSLLEQVIMNGNNGRIETKGADAQIESIQEKLNKISTWLKNDH